MRTYLLPRKFALWWVVIFTGAWSLHRTGMFSAETLAAYLSVPCPFEYITSLPCPGCGMTRALFSLVRGDLFSALAVNPSVAILSVIVLISALPDEFLLKAGRRGIMIIRLSMGGALTGVLVFWFVWRLLPALR